MKTNTKDIVEIIGIFAIVVSLIFVGIQLRLERKVAMADQYFNRAESVKEDYRTRLLSSEYFRAVEEHWAITGQTYYSDSDWPEMQQVRDGVRRISSVDALMLVDKLQIVGYDNLYFQYKQGLIDELTWNGLRRGLKKSMAYSELTRDVFLQGARPNIRPVVEEIFKELESERIEKQ